LLDGRLTALAGGWGDDGVSALHSDHGAAHRADGSRGGGHGELAVLRQRRRDGTHLPAIAGDTLHPPLTSSLTLPPGATTVGRIESRAAAVRDWRLVHDRARARSWRHGNRLPRPRYQAPAPRR